MLPCRKAAIYSENRAFSHKNRGIDEIGGVANDLIGLQIALRGAQRAITGQETSGSVFAGRETGWKTSRHNFYTTSCKLLHVIM